MSFDENNLKKIKISIGLPVFNGEKFLSKKLESILSQTFTNFELIISDNASTDSTSDICKEFERKDKRIQYFRQEKTIAPILNYEYLLQKANCEYFLWTAVDDVLHQNFLEKNIEIIKNDEKIVCSISKMKLFGPMTEYMDSKNENNSLFYKIHKKIYQKTGFQNTFPVSGNYENRIKEYIKNIRHNQVLYGVYRTKQLKKSFVQDSFIGNDAAITFNLLKYGEIYVIDEILMQVFDGGISRSGMIEAMKKMHHKKFGLIFPFMPFTRWCIQNLGPHVFMKNFIFFIKINFEGILSLWIDVIRKLRYRH